MTKESALHDLALERARLTVDDQTFTQPITVKKHPLSTVSDEDLRAQFELASRIRDKVNEANNAIINSGLGRGCTHSVRMRRGPGALTGPGSPTR